MREAEITKSGVRRLTRFFLLGFLLLLLTGVSNSQRIVRQNGNARTLPARQTQGGGDDEDFIKPARPGVANPAEIQKPGVLQIEFGYDSNFRAPDFRFQQAAPLNIRFAASSRFLLEAEIETVKSERREQSDPLETGVGDTRLGFQIVALKESERRPALAFAYHAKLPTASESKMLGTGRADHRVTALLSKKLGENTDLDLNVAYLNVGREDSSRRADGGLAAVSVSHEFENKFGFELELSGSSVDEPQSKGVYALGALTYQFNKRLRFDTGMRFGLSGEAPRAGFFAGLTVGAANLFKR